jgi:5'(3')-deoxyribonucleotidase
MNIGISINEVLRDFLTQFIYTYDKYIEKTEIKVEEITEYDLMKHFKFENVDKLNTFLYLESPLEIFGHADQLHNNLMNHFNEFLNDIEFDGEHHVKLVSREVNKSIPSTLFFLSKTGCRAQSINFVKNHIDEWDGVDILITANPVALLNKPENKISVKITAPYNKDVSADYEISSILEFFKDMSLRERILTKIITTNYEEI